MIRPTTTAKVRTCHLNFLTKTGNMTSGLKRVHTSALLYEGLSFMQSNQARSAGRPSKGSVSYTHLTLPTKA